MNEGDAFVRGLRFACLLSCLVACKKDADAEAKAALRDVRKACEHMAKWPRPLKRSCTRCMAYSTTPACNCPSDKEVYSGQCYPPRQAQVDEKSCEPVSACVNKCARSDCECITRCYDAQERCYKLASMVDGCVADVCDAHCR
jgi:hypothetical protein